MAFDSQKPNEGPADQSRATDDNDLHAHVSHASACPHDEIAAASVTWDDGRIEKICGMMSQRTGLPRQASERR